MANRYETNLILERIADGLNDDQNSALIDALTTIANAISQSGGGDIPSGGTMGQLLGKRSNQDFDLTWYDNMGDDALSNQASVYNPQSNYVVGDYCLHTNYLYVCISPTTGNWDSTCWNRVQFGEQISTLNSNLSTLSDRVDANTRGTAVNLTSYTTSSNQYTFPSDGYILVKSGDNINDYVTIRVANIIDLTAKTQQTNYSEGNCLYVKKGMKCYVLAKNGTTYVANYYPITSGS